MCFDYLIIGSGQAGVPLATRLAEIGRRVVIVERSLLGGTCVNTGCTPTKTMIASARVAHLARAAGRLGVRTGQVKVDLAQVVDRKEEIVKQWRDGVANRLSKAGENLLLVRGHARFIRPKTIEVNGQQYEANRIVINVGCHPLEPQIPGLSTVPWLDNDRAMQLREAPRHLIVLGGGYIGCELGQMFRRFGAKVTIIDHNPHLLSREDEDISRSIEEVFTKEGIQLRLGATVARVSREGKAQAVREEEARVSLEGETRAARKGKAGVPGEGQAQLSFQEGEKIAVHFAKGSKMTGTHLLVATGRVPNTRDLACENGSITLDEKGFIIVDDHYRTSAEGVYAVGDVTGGPQFTHSSWDDHRILLGLLEGGDPKGTGNAKSVASRTRKDRLIPYAVFTDPAVGRVGLSEREAKEKGVQYEISTLPFGSIARAIETGETAGLLKVLIDPDTERILGAGIVGVEAAELVHVFVAMMQAGVNARTLVDAEMIHPALAEGLQSVVMGFERYK